MRLATECKFAAKRRQGKYKLVLQDGVLQAMLYSHLGEDVLAFRFRLRINCSLVALKDNMPMASSVTYFDGQSAMNRLRSGAAFALNRVGGVQRI